jgi:hypothetical protein
MFAPLVNFLAKSSVRWILTFILGGLIWFCVGSWAHHLRTVQQERDAVAAAERVANLLPVTPLCTQVDTIQVRNPDGTVRSTTSDERKVACEPRAATPAAEYHMTQGVKWTLIGLAVLFLLFLCWCGGWEAVLQIVFIVLTGL